MIFLISRQRFRLNQQVIQYYQHHPQQLIHLTQMFWAQSHFSVQLVYPYRIHILFNEKYGDLTWNIIIIILILVVNF